MRRAVVLFALAVLVILLGYAMLVLAGAGLPRVGNLDGHAPSRTSLMRAREKEARRRHRPYHVDQRWISYRRISPLLRSAVLIAEDDAFYSHAGLDWDQMQQAARENLEEKRIVRGGSTITQQLAKNLYLGEERTLLRKLKEILLAIRLERTLSKRRIFELYLNVIEWGDGIFGAEAAARRYFGVPASELSARQAALLASVIVNPRRYSPVSPGRHVQRRMRMILGRMYVRGILSEDQYREALGQPPKRRRGFWDWLFGPPQPPAPPGPSSEIPAEPESASRTTDSVLQAPRDTVPEPI